MSAQEIVNVPFKRCALVSIATLALMLFALATNCGNAFGQIESAPPTTDDNTVTLFTEDTAKWGRATRVVLPDYPLDALEKGIGVDVSIKLVINVLGGVKSISSIVANPKIPEFEAAVREVVNT